MQPRGFLAILFILSGFSALSYQVVWQRVLTQEIGVDAVSIAFIVSIFIAGLGIGSALHRSVTDLSLKAKRRLYIGLEAAIGGFGLISVALIRFANQTAPVGDSLIAQFAVNALVILPVTIAMGLTTPLVLDLAKSRDDETGRVAGFFYGSNIAGAALGAGVTGLFLIQLFGLGGVSRIAAGINLLLAAALWLAFKPGHEREKAAPVERPSRSLSIAAFLFGFGLISLQMVYFRTAANHFLMFAYVFPLMLASFLVAMAFGQYLFGQIADRTAKPSEAMGASLVLFALCLVVLFRLPIGWLQADSGGRVEYWLPMFAYAGLFMVPVAIGSGMFTMLVRFATPSGGALGGRFGHMMAMASFGNAVGALAGPLILFSLIGTIGALVLAALAYVGGYLCFSPRWRLAISGALISFLLPLGYFEGNSLYQTPAVKAVEIGEESVGVVSTFRYDEGNAVSIQIARSGTSTIYQDARAGDYAMKPLEMLLPDRPNHMLIIGMGGANYLPSLLSNERIEQITIVELSQAVIDGARRYGSPDLKAVLSSPKVEIVHGDGRRYLAMANRNGLKFDVIQNGVFQPWMSGAANLYTVETTRMAQRALTPGGLFITLDLEGIAQTTGRVFPAAYSQPGDRYVYFPVDPALAVPGLCLRRLTPTAAPNTDDRPIFEYWMAGVFQEGVGELQSWQARPYLRDKCST